MNQTPTPVVPLTDAQIKAASVVRIERAMALIEMAQNNLASACGELSALEGGITVWKMCHKMTDRVHTFWYRVLKFRQTGRYRLDRDNIATLQRRIAEAKRTPIT